MDLGIKGKRALVCGGSKGLGYAIAEAMAKEGVELCLLGRDQDSLSAAAKKLSNSGAQAVDVIKCDLLDVESRQKAIAQIQALWGAPDIVIHNVGGPRATFVLDTDSAAWREGFERLFMPIVDFNHAFVPVMKEKKWGRIITITSLSVAQPVPMLAISNALRSAVTSMSKTLSDEVARDGITVNCVAPSTIATERSGELAKSRMKFSGLSAEEDTAQLVSAIPVGREGTPEEFAGVVTFMCSQQAAYMTGATICVDGGKRRSTY